MKKTVIIIICIASLMLLCSCESAFMKSVYAVLGIDDHDYEGEAVINTPDLQSDEVKALSDTAKILAYGKDVLPFDSFSDEADGYVDIVLDYLASVFYSKYSSDKDLLERFSEDYPELNLSLLIPRSDYENTVYRCFGGSKKAVVRSTAMFSYLAKTDAFMLVGQIPVSDASVRVMTAEETENTYRLSVSFSRDGQNTGIYDLIFRKRAEGEPYIWRVTKTNKVFSLGD